MTKETTKLAEKNDALKIKQIKKDFNQDKKPTGYQVITEVIVNLLGCVLIGASLGVVFQNMFDTSVKLTVALTFLGGVAGIWSVIKYALSLEQKEGSK